MYRRGPLGRVAQVLNFRQEKQGPLRHRRGAVEGSHAPAVQLNPRCRVLTEDGLEDAPEEGLEIVHASVVRAELLLERYPRDELRLGPVDPVQALREPCIYVQANGRVGEGSNAPFDLAPASRTGR